ncbi:MAG: ribosome maturation factor RimM [Bacteroidota bacterium]
MTKNECFNLGYIAKRVGNFGELAFVLDVDNPGKYQKLESVFVELNNTLVPFFIKKIHLRGNTAVATVEGIDTIDKAEELIKSGLYLPLSMLPPLKGKQFYFHEMPGYTVIDKTYGEIGVVEKVLDYPQQAIFQVKKDDHEILIPAKDDFIVSINRDTKQLHINAPEGLIDIYISNKEEIPDVEEEEDN